MNMFIRVGFYTFSAILIGVFSAVGTAFCAEDPAAGTFVRQIVDAINRKDDESRKRLMHPDVLPCSQAQKNAMAVGAFTPKWNPIPVSYHWEIKPLPPGSAGWFSEKFDYPFPPTHQLQIDFDTAPNQSQSIVLQIVRYQNEWREITGCPKAATIIEAREAGKARGQQEERIRKLAVSIPLKLKIEVQQLLADGQKVAAILRYRDATNEDLSITKGVIERMINESEGQRGR